MSEIGIGVVGCGQIADAHLKGIEACDGARVAFCVDVDADRAARAAEPYGCPSSTGMADALGEAAVDAVVLCLPHDLHLPFALEVLSAGKHVLVEKPMALNAAEAREMVGAAERANRHLMVGQSTRFLASHQEAKRLIETGRIGTPRSASRQTYFRVERLSTDWRRDTAACGGLYLPLFGSHDVDAMLWLLDDCPDRVSAAIASGSHLSDGDVEGWIGMSFDDGKTGSIAFSLRSEETRQATTIVGTEGAMTVTRNDLTLDGEAVALDGEAWPFGRQMAAFVEGIRVGGPPAVPGTDGLRTMRVLDLARAASDGRRTLEYGDRG